jgi:YfiH family protein
VASNRSVFALALGARPVFLQQIHGEQVALLDSQTPDGTRADGCVTRAHGLACTIMVADCLPVLLCSADGAVVAAAHAGWRGLAGSRTAGAPLGGILESIFESFTREVHASGSSPAIENIANHTLAWLGPCIGPRAFEVGQEVLDAFCAGDPSAAQHFVATGGGKYLANLPGLARQRLAGLGITQIYGNDGSDAWCTVSNPLRFFSHRRDAGRLGNSGRLAAAIWKL